VFTQFVTSALDGRLVVPWTTLLAIIQLIHCRCIQSLNILLKPTLMGWQREVHLPVMCFTSTPSRGSGFKILTREKLSPTKSQNLVRPLLAKILCLCVAFFLSLSNLPNFLQRGLRNYSSPTLAWVKLPPFCQFWQQQHVPQIRQCVSCLGTIIGSPVKSLCPNLRDAMIEVGTKQFFN
jgi:hypothetical protein